jgi:hypothetical protein
MGIGLHFLTNAVDITPPTTDPTMGDTGDATSPGIAFANYIFGSVFTAPADIRVGAIRAYCGNAGATTKCAIYRNSDRALIATSEEKTTVSGWNTFNVPSRPLLTAGTAYILCIWQGAQVLGVVRRALTGQTWYYLTRTYNSWPDPLPSWTGSAADYVLCIHTVGVNVAQILGTTLDAILSYATANVIMGSVFTPNVTFKADAIRAYCTAVGYKTKCAIYRNSDRALIASSEEKTTDNIGWNLFKLTTKPTLTAGTAYILCIWQGALLGNVKTALTGQTWYYLTRTYDSWPDPLPAWTGSVADQVQCIHVIGAWQTVDLSPYIPAGSTGAILDIHNTYTANLKSDVRKPGSTDFHYAIWRHDLGTPAGYHRYAIVGLDTLKLEVLPETTDLKIYLVGYTDSYFTFFTNALERTGTRNNEWETIDISADVPIEATAAILKLVNKGATLIGDARKPGSPEDYTSVGYFNEPITLIVGLTERKFEKYLSDVNSQIVCLVGYAVKPFKPYTTPKIFTPAAGSWQTINLKGLIPKDAEGIFIQIRNHDASVTRIGEVRKKGSTDDRTATAKIRLSGHIGAYVGVDSTLNFEAYVETTNVKLYLYAPAAVKRPSGIWRLTPPKRRIAITNPTRL